MKVLFITPSYPVPAHSGAAIAALETLRSIQSQCELHLLTPAPETESEANQQQLQEALPAVTVHYYRPCPVQAGRAEMYLTAARVIAMGGNYWARIWFNRDLRAAVQRLHTAQSFQVVHCEWLQPAVSLAGLNLPLIIRTLDVHFVGMAHWAARLPARQRISKVFWRSQAERFRRFESQILTAAEFVLTLSAEDETTLRREGVSNIITIPPPRESVPEYPRSSNSRESTLAVFVGRLDMEVNREAFFVFADQVWPRIPMEVRAKVRVVFAGGVPDEDICRRAREDGLDLHAQPSDLEAEQLFEEADIFLSPVQSGTGIKIKTLEAMARGKAMIGFPQAFRGVPVEHDKHALVAASAEDFARSFEALVSDAAKRQKFGQAAREFIRLNFSPKILGKQLIAVYEKVAREYIQKQQHGQPVLL